MILADPPPSLCPSPNPKGRAHWQTPPAHTWEFLQSLHTPNHNTSNNLIQQYGRKWEDLKIASLSGLQDLQLPCWILFSSKSRKRNTSAKPPEIRKVLMCVCSSEFLNFFPLNPFRFYLFIYLIYSSVSFVASAPSSIQPHHNGQCNMPSKGAFLTPDTQHHRV